jgi:hypothetical protein
MPKKSTVSKTPIKTLDLDKKIDAIKGEIDNIIVQEEKQLELENDDDDKVVHLEPIKKQAKQPKIIEEIVEEDEPEPIIIRKIIKKKPKQIIEEVEEIEEEPVKPKKKDGRGRPFGSVKKSSQQPEQQQQSYNNRERFDTILDESNIELLRQEMRKEMKRRLMSSLFD